MPLAFHEMILREVRSVFGSIKEWEEMDNGRNLGVGTDCMDEGTEVREELSNVDQGVECLDFGD